MIKDKEQMDDERRFLDFLELAPAEFEATDPGPDLYRR